MLKRLIMIAVALSVAVAVAAQEPPPIAVVAQVLSLSEDQIHALGDFLQARGAAVQPAIEELQRHQQALAQQLQSSNPDPATIGHLILEMRAIEGQIQKAIGDANKTLDQILSDEQRTRLDQLRGAGGACQVIPAFKAVGLL
jgi:septal ring factor EnvC (AmiA/AmiB activator)